MLVRQYLSLRVNLNREKTAADIANGSGDGGTAKAPINCQSKTETQQSALFHRPGGPVSPLQTEWTISTGDNNANIEIFYNRSNFAAFYHGFVKRSFRIRIYAVLVYLC